jgi:hypothetical protein
MVKKNIFVFPCGSEIALEINRSLKYNTHFNLIGGSSIDDHGRFVFDNYIDGIPFVTDSRFIPTIKDIVNKNKIDVIYATMDSVIVELKKNEIEIGCKVLSPDIEVVELCLSKHKTYDRLKDIIKVPKLYHYTQIKEYPVFGKPDIGYGSRGVKKIDNYEMLQEYINNNHNVLLCEYLSGEEYTVDCFTDKKGTLLFYKPRIRKRIMNGISVNTILYNEKNNEFEQIIKKINREVKFRGAWFAQFKRNEQNELVLLEIAARFGGSSSLFRAKGINFAQLTLFDFFNNNVSFIENDYNVELDRALDNVFKIDIQYNEIFCDFENCLLIDEKYINVKLVSFLYQCVNEKKKLTLLTNKNNIEITLKKYHLYSIFDRIIYVDTKKMIINNYIDNIQSIYISPSFTNRKIIHLEKNIPVFDLDNITVLLK